MKKRNFDTKTGIIRMHPRGFGFVVFSDDTPDVFIPKRLTMNAVDGDTVDVEITGTSDKGPDGRVIEIVERGRKTLAGIITGKENGTYNAFAPLLGPQKEIVVKSKKALKSGDRYIFQIESWEEKNKPTVCTPLESVGHINDATADVKASLKAFELRGKFPNGVVSEAKKFGVKVTKKDLDSRQDFRKLETFTIDPTDARDYDDALSLAKEKDGSYTLHVHIADVSHYVQVGSRLDEEAKERGNSTYFPGQCIPMLPEELSNELCSLKEKVDRLTVTAIMKFSKEGDLLHYEIVKGVIHSQKRMTYNEAFEVIEGKRKSKHNKTLDLMVELCGLLKAKRSARGSVDLAMPETRLIVGDNGIPTGYTVEEYDITHQLVEEFMLKANEVVAHKLIDMGAGAIFRVHEEPAAKDFEDFVKLATRLGYKISSDPTKGDIQTLFEQAKTSPQLHDLSVAYIRSMKLAIYSERNVGHYGLGLEHYCHFTSPIRRYSDLIVHRLLFDEKVDELESIATHCSEKERMSFRAEQSITLLKKLRYLETLHDENPNRTYKVTITKIKPFGITFSLSPLNIEGHFHVSALRGDYYTHNPKTDTLVGNRTGKKYRPGDTLTVSLEMIDLIYLETSWKLLP